MKKEIQIDISHFQFMKVAVAYDYIYINSNISISRYKLATCNYNFTSGPLNKSSRYYANLPLHLLFIRNTSISALRTYRRTEQQSCKQ